MRKLILIASAAVMAATVPSVASAEPGKNQNARSGHQARGHGNADNRGRRVIRDTRRDVRVDRRVDSDRDGIPDFRDRTDDRRGNRYGGAACPPGLANRTPACVPPGQARRMFREGQVIPRSYRDYLSYQDLLGRLPDDYDNRIPVGDYRYIYQNDNVYVVDPRTRLVRNIIDILR